jgi:hypothetical protein
VNFLKAQWKKARGVFLGVTFFEEGSVNKRRLAVGVFLVLFGMIPLINSFSNPRISGMRMVDKIQLLSSGGCLGVGIGILIGGRKFLNEK